MSRTQEVLRDWIDACAQSSYLNQWEEEFIESVDKALDKYGELTVRQEEALERIYAQRTK